ncbi:MAG: Gfo/Idh/MocA family oxidoreductase [Betaproteobacteria bacterium]|nr:Gfo/Idh/MocA family oxidoreductase [Betaproteobacteria bacterium]
MPKNCIIIGLGQIGMGYDLANPSAKVVYTHAKALAIHPAFNLVGGVDPSKMQRILFEEHYRRPAYFSIADALEQNTVSVVVVASPTANHCMAIKEVLAYSSPKAILCEKPLAFDLADAHEMIEICESAGVKLFVNYMRRADPGCIEIKARIESGQITGPIKVVVWYSKGFLHNGSHFFNILEFWLGSFIKAKIIDPGRLWNNQDPEPDVQVEFERGKAFFIASWEESFSHYTIELLSPSGRLRYEQGGEVVAWQSTHADPNFVGYVQLQTNPEIITNGMVRYQWHVAEQLANALEDKPTTLSTGRESLATIRSIHQIFNQRLSCLQKN